MAALRTDEQLFPPIREANSDEVLDGAIAQIVTILRSMTPGDKLVIRRYDQRTPADHLFVVEHHDYG